MNRRRTRRLVCLSWVCSASLIGCGGNEAIGSLPVADAGYDRHDAAIGEATVLDGSGSFDPDGEALTYRWTITSQPVGGEALREAGDSAGQTLLVPDRVGTYLVTLQVSTGERTSRPDAVAVEVPNGAPTAVAECDGGGCSALHGTTVGLVGNLSEDPDGTELFYLWYQITGLAECEATCPELVCDPSSASVGVIQNADSKQASVVLPEVADEQLVFALEVSDGLVSDTACLAYTATNTPPQFNADPNVAPAASQDEGSTFTFTCFPSDADGDSFTITWHQVSPVTPIVLPAVVNLANLSVTVPLGTIDADTDFQFDVELFDGVDSVMASDGPHPVPLISVIY